MNTRPELNEYDPFYHRYICLAPEGNIKDVLMNQKKTAAEFFGNFSEEQSYFSYAPEKWSIKEVLGHITDTERIMAYRLLAIARGESVSLPGFDENSYVANASFNQRSLQDLIDDFLLVRESSISLIKSLQPDLLTRLGEANQSKVSVRALGYIIAGHELHHRKILKERYAASPEFPQYNRI
ncbi:DinB family protein [Heyndrickxia acidicola]|uniref:DinB family protein n=1 Tax=Heyndrickxia acidicola TaxID=209389 RepID=A0ABU6MHE8_9BACI|nr:DinB family protein [Heyndrickxia acidicola]MED1204091.1 DinB family protein [Heyndrickxia acidicola]